VNWIILDEDIRRAAGAMPHDDAGCQDPIGACQQQRLDDAARVLAAAAPALYGRWVAEAFEREAAQRARGSFVHTYLRRLARKYRETSDDGPVLVRAELEER
jgi:hypothetical protein